MGKTAIDVQAPDVRGGTVYGRVLMASLFVVSGLLKVIHFSSVLSMLADSGLPFGWRVRWAANSLRMIHA